jgi:hypothetical protein
VPARKAPMRDLRQFTRGKPNHQINKEGMPAPTGHRSQGSVQRNWPAVARLMSGCRKAIFSYRVFIRISRKLVVTWHRAQSSPKPP